MYWQDTASEKASHQANLDEKNTAKWPYFGGQIGTFS